MNQDSSQRTFQRIEQKYLLSAQQYNTLMDRLRSQLRPDEFCRSTICSIYYDTPDYRLIRASLDRPVYKEKLRLRSYGDPTQESTVFVEIKKKYDGVVYKRRVPMSLAEAERYLSHNIHPAGECQILREIDWFKRYYDGLHPVVFLSYDREAYLACQNLALRFTFDTNIRWRKSHLHLGDGVGGQRLLEEDLHLMELKIPDALPIPLVRLLEELEIRQTSYSKYGAAYQTHLAGRVAAKGGLVCA